MLSVKINGVEYVVEGALTVATHRRCVVKQKDAGPAERAAQTAGFLGGFRAEDEPLPLPVPLAPPPAPAPAPPPPLEDEELPTICFNRQKFFEEYRRQFKPVGRKTRLTSAQVKGLETLLRFMETFSVIQGKPADVPLIPRLAYMLATVKHETANTFQPIEEIGRRAYFNKYDPVLARTRRHKERARKMGNTQKGDGEKYKGRGYVQITWKSNYQKMTGILGANLVSNPERALEPRIAYGIMAAGMLRGIFTGKKLGDYITDAGVNYVGARRVINGTDRAGLIARYAVKFEAVLRASETRRA